MDSDHYLDEQSRKRNDDNEIFQRNKKTPTYPTKTNDEKFETLPKCMQETKTDLKSKMQKIRLDQISYNKTKTTILRKKKKVFTYLKQNIKLVDTETAKKTWC